MDRTRQASPCRVLFRESWTASPAADWQDCQPASTLGFTRSGCQIDEAERRLHHDAQRPAAAEVNKSPLPCPSPPLSVHPLVGCTRRLGHRGGCKENGVGQVLATWCASSGAPNATALRSAHCYGCCGCSACDGADCEACPSSFLCSSLRSSRTAVEQQAAGTADASRSRAPTGHPSGACHSTHGEPRRCPAPTGPQGGQRGRTDRQRHHGPCRRLSGREHCCTVHGQQEEGSVVPLRVQVCGGDQLHGRPYRVQHSAGCGPGRLTGGRRCQLDLHACVQHWG